MQGNERNRMNLDEQFVSEAWESMSEMLDRNLPVGDTPPVAATTNRNSRALLLLLLLFGFGAGASLMYWFQPKEQPLMESAPQNEPRANLESPKKTTAIAENTIGSDQNTSSEKPIDVLPPDVPSTAIFSTKNAKPSFAASPGTKHKEKNTHKEAEREAEREAVTSKGQPAVKSEKTEIGQGNISSAPPANISERKHEVVSPLARLLEELPKVENPSPESAVELKKEKRWNFFAEAATLRDKGTREFGGFSTGMRVNYELDKRFSIQSGLSWHHLAKTPRNPLNSNNDITYVNIDPKPGTPFSNGSLEDLLNFQSASAAITAMDYLKVPLQLSFNINKHIQFYSGFHVAYYLNAIGANKENENTKLFSSLSEKEKAEILADTRSRKARRGLKKWDYGLQIGMAFYSNRNLGFFINYNVGLPDFSDDEYFGSIREIHTNEYLQLGLNYYLFNR